MPENQTNSAHDAQLDALEAFLEAVEGKREAALARLDGKTDPDSIAQRLAILLEADRAQEAVELIQGLEPDKKWCDKAAHALALYGDWPAAKGILDRAAESLTDLPARHRCIIACAQGGYAHAMRNRGDEAPIMPGTLTPEEEDGLRRVAAVLEPFAQFVTAKRRVDSELEAQGIRQAMLCHIWLRNHRNVRELAEILETRRPLPELLPRLALVGLVQAKEGWPERLRVENSTSFERSMLAALTEGVCLGKASEAFERLLGDTEAASSDTERDQLYGVLDQIAQAAGADALAKMDDLAPRLLSHNSRLLKLHQAERFLRGGEPREAQQALEEILDENDPVWLQIQAHCLLQQGKGDAATECLRKACDILPHPAILGLAAQVAFRQDRLGDARWALEQLLSLLPDDPGAHSNMATVCMLECDFEHAAGHFAVLQELQPEEVTHGLNRAACLARSNDLAGAIRVYSEVLGGTDAPLEALLGKAAALRAQNQPKEAFAQLQSGRESYWDDSRFVLAYMDLSYAAEAESAGNEALLQLGKLQAAGKAGPEVLQAKTLEDLKGYISDHKKKVDELHEGILRGRIPWLMADSLLNVVSYSGWLMRTQALRWVWDDSVNRAQRAVYSTNTFGVRLTQEGKKELQQLAYPERGTRVAADLSSLITLHRLEMLATATDYFGQVLVPSVYLSHALDEKGRLVLHQPSHKTGLSAVKDAVDRSVIKALAEAGAPGSRPLPYVHEHTLEEHEDEHYYRLVDLAYPLLRAGRLAETKHEELMKVAHKPSGEDEKHAALELGQAILVGLSTLQTLSGSGVLDLVIGAYEVYIAEEDRQSVIAGMASIALQEDVYKWHTELWDHVRSDAQFVLAPCAIPKDFREETRLGHMEVPLAAVLLAQEADVPLLVDDRVCQAVLLNAKPDGPYPAFGTDRLLLGLAEAGLISQDRLADAMCQLMEWRYRFILPSPQVLKTLADRYREHPPGNDLRAVALYVHDCMRDPGLLGGFELTEPPTTIATRLYNAWAGSIGKFVIHVWEDASFEEGNAAELTRWAMHEFLPSTPRSVGPGAPGLAVLLPRMVLSQAMLHACAAKDQERMKAALKAISEGLGMTPDEFTKATVEIIDVF